MAIEDNGSVLACRKVVESAQESPIPGPRKRKRKVAEDQYLVTFNTGDEALFSYEEVYEYCLYEEAPLRIPFDTLITKILSQRMLIFVLPFVVYTKRTERQIRERVCRGIYGTEPLWKRYEEAAIEGLMADLRARQYADDIRYTESYVSQQRQKPVSARALQRTLQDRGIDAALAEEVVRTAEIDEIANARILVEKRLRGRQCPDGRLTQKERAQLYRFLSGKGFSADTVICVIEEYGADEDAYE